MKSEDMQFNKYSRGKQKKENIFLKNQKQSSETNSRRRICREGKPRRPDRQEQGREDKGRGPGTSPSQDSC